MDTAGQFFRIVSIGRILSLCFCLNAFFVSSQGLPKEMHFSEDGRRILVGDIADTGFYNPSVIRSVHLVFTQPNYFEMMDSIYWEWTKQEIPATMIVDGITYNNVGVRFKGQSSFQQIPFSQKKSFSISLDYTNPDQSVRGYKSLNFHNGYEDPSFMREMFFEGSIRRHIPAVKVAYIHLYLNGEDWGLYTNAQQVNKIFYKEWYLSAKGSSWRGVRPDGQWFPDGNGRSALNYLGPDSADYKEEYSLKFTDKVNPWQDLLHACEVLNNTPLQKLPDSLPAVLDVDRALWFLASEILFSDEDSYIDKGRMDYYFYWEKETGRIAPQEWDANGTMKFANKFWSAFYHADSVNYPLMNRLFQVPEYRQRYLAHLRTIIDEYFDIAKSDSILNSLHLMIDTIVQNDPKKLYTYQHFLTEIQVLKNFISYRRAYLKNDVEVAKIPPQLSQVAWYVNDSAWGMTEAMKPVIVRAKAGSAYGIYKMHLFYSSSIVGNFNKIEMFDDGQHSDLLAGDGIYGAAIPGQEAGLWIRFYVEAVSGNSSRTVVYDPPGAEHDTYIYYSGLTDVEEKAGLAKNIIIKPNPNDGRFSLVNLAYRDSEYDGAINEIIIYDLAGKIIYRKSFPHRPSVINLDMASHARGLYFLEVISNGKSFREKVVIQPQGGDNQ